MSSEAWGEKEEAAISSFHLVETRVNVHLASSWKPDHSVERDHSQRRFGHDWHYVLLGLFISLNPPLPHVAMSVSPVYLRLGLTFWQLISVRDSVLVHFHPFSKIHIRVFHFSCGIITFSSCVLFPRTISVCGTSMRSWSLDLRDSGGCTRSDTGVSGWEVFEDIRS